MNGSISLNNRETELCEAIGEAVPLMSEFQKGYLLGVAESVREHHKAKKKDEKEQAEEDTEA